MYLKYMDLRLLLPILSALLLAACSPAVRFTRPGPSIRPNTAYSGTVPAPTNAGAPQWLNVDQQKMMDVINRMKGIPYKWGGTDERGIDCSAFVQAVFRRSQDIRLPRTSREQSDYGKSVSRDDLKFGDLVFFKIHSFRINHVGIYVGEGMFAHSSWTEGVTVTRLDDSYYSPKYSRARRLFTE